MFQKKSVLHVLVEVKTKMGTLKSRQRKLWEFPEGRGSTLFKCRMEVRRVSAEAEEVEANDTGGDTVESQELQEALGRAAKARAECHSLTNIGKPDE